MVIAAHPYDVARSAFVQFGILGTVEARADGGRQVRLGGPRERKVLAALLLREGRGVRIEYLTEVVWGERPPATSRAQIHNSVAALRRGLAGAAPASTEIESAKGAFTLHVGEAGFDARRFARKTAEADELIAGGQPVEAADRLRDALDLWRGPALDGVDSDELRGHAQQLDEQRMTALERRIELDLSLGRHDVLTGELSALTIQYPLRERFVAQHMLALYRAHRQADALAAFHTCRTLLMKELAVEPGPALTLLHGRMLRGDDELLMPPAASVEPGRPIPARVSADSRPAPRPGPQPPQARRPVPAPRQLPAGVNDFVGRGRTVEEVCAALAIQTGAVPVVTVAGMGGIGKTSLAIRVAHLARERFPDGQLFADLRGSRETPRSPVDVLARFVRALGHDDTLPAGEDELATLYRSLLCDRRVLIVLDDAAELAQIRPLLPGYQGSAAIVTSRRRLAGLDGARAFDLDGLDPVLAADLFGGIVGADRVTAEPEATETVLAACAGMPLALRLLGARLASRPDWAIADLARRLTERPAPLDEMTDGDRSVRNGLEASFAMLDPLAARHLHLLGLWDGASFGPAQFAALTGASVAETETELGALIGVHLVQAPALGRYRLHDLVHQHAAESVLRLESRPDRDAAVRRLLTWYLNAADNARRAIRPVRDTAMPHYEGPAPVPEFAESAAALDWLDQEHGNLTATARAALRSEMYDLVWCVPLVLADLCQLRGYWTEWLNLCELGLSAARSLPDRRPEAVIANIAGTACLALRRLDEAVEHYSRAAELNRESGSRLLEGFILNNLGDTLHALGANERAVEALTRALAIAEESDSVRLLGHVLFNLGNVDAAEGRLDSAVERYRRACEIYRTIGRVDAEGQVFTALAAAYQRLDRGCEALEALEQAVRVHRDSGDRPNQAAALRDLGDALWQADQPERAHAAWSSACELLEGMDGPDAVEIRSRLARFG
jgi:DNA-binding SARP family transcriptional activator/tetratricopeptide (TPR) repeat protein